MGARGHHGETCHGRVTGCCGRHIFGAFDLCSYGQYSTHQALQHGMSHRGLPRICQVSISACKAQHFGSDRTAYVPTQLRRLAALAACSGWPLSRLELAGAVPLSEGVAYAVHGCCPQLSSLCLDHRKDNKGFSTPLRPRPAWESTDAYHLGCKRLLELCGPRLTDLQLRGVYGWRSLSYMTLRYCAALASLQLEAGWRHPGPDGCYRGQYAGEPRRTAPMLHGWGAGYSSRWYTVTEDDKIQADVCRGRRQHATLSLVKGIPPEASSSVFGTAHLHATPRTASSVAAAPPEACGSLYVCGRARVPMRCPPQCAREFILPTSTPP